MLTEYEEGGGPKQDILEADEDEAEEMEVDADGAGDAGRGASESEGECEQGASVSYITCVLALQRPCVPCDS